MQDAKVQGLAHVKQKTNACFFLLISFQISTGQFRTRKCKFREKSHPLKRLVITVLSNRNIMQAAYVNLKILVASLKSNKG